MTEFETPKDQSSAPATIEQPTLIPVTVAHGDGIGPEIMESVLRILDAAGAPLRYERIEIGQKVYAQGHTSGIAPETWDIIRKNKVLLKAPISTPQGGGYKSLNVTIRKTLNLFANVRPSRAYAPFIVSQHPGMNLVIIRENEEDLYAGIEHQQTHEVVQVLKLITRPGSERIIRYAFEYARAYGRRKVTCMTKDNIMKHTDGLFHRCFDEVAAEYPDLESEHHIIDIGAARLAALPEHFDVIVTLNLYGDILSDIAAQIAGSVGLAGSANIGLKAAMFEAVHGSAPDIAGKGIANPSGLLSAATMMLVHLGVAEVASRIENAWLKTIEDGIHTNDIYRSGISRTPVSGARFADAIIERLGQQSQVLKPVQYRPGGIQVTLSPSPTSQKQLVGVDLFVDWEEADRDPDQLGAQLTAATPAGWQLTTITNRGLKVYPDGFPETIMTDQWCCRFSRTQTETATFAQIIALMQAIDAAGLDIIKTEHLYTFDGERGYSLGQGE